MRAKASNFVHANSRLGAIGLAFVLATDLAPVALGKSRRADPNKPATTVSLRDTVQAAIAKADFAAVQNTLGESYRQAPQAEKLFLWAQILGAQGKNVEAADLFRRFLAEGGASDEDQRTARLAMEKHLPPTGEVVVESERGAMVLVDNRPVGILPLAAPLLLTPGPHKIAVAVGNKRLEETHKALAARVAELRFNLSSDVVVASYQKAALLIVLPPPGPVSKEAPAVHVSLETVEKAALQVVGSRGLGLQTQGHALLSAPTLANCLGQEKCQFSLAEENQATWLLVLHSSVTENKRDGRLVQFHVSVFDPAISEAAAKTEKTCSRCETDGAKAKAAEAMAEALDAALNRTKGTLVVRSTPNGAETYLGERLLGGTPVRLPVWAGTYPLLLRKAGFVSVRREASIAAGQKQTYEFTLVAGLAGEDAPGPEKPDKPPVAIPSSGRPTWRIVTGATAIGLGALALGFGISALTVNNHCVSGLSESATQCPQLYDTLVPGAALSGVGGAALIAGTLLLVWPPPKKPSLTTNPSQ